MNNLKRMLVLSLLIWVQAVQIGFAWNSAQCVFTGAKKWKLGTAKSCCLMAKSWSSSQDSQAHFKPQCCQYKDFELKVKAHSFKTNDVNWQLLALTSSNYLDFSYFVSQHPLARFLLAQPSHAPPLQQRLAQLQVYRI